MVTVSDVVALVGLAMLAVGLWLVHPAACLIVIGALLLMASVSGTKRRGKE